MAERRFKHSPEGMWWVERGRCIGEDPELFFPVGTSEQAQRQLVLAKQVCLACPVRADCLEWSLVTCQDAGVWGGLDEEERREIRRERRRSVAAAAVAASSLEDELVAV